MNKIKRKERVKCTSNLKMSRETFGQDIGQEISAIEAKNVKTHKIKQRFKEKFRVKSNSTTKNGQTKTKLTENIRIIG